MLTCKLRFAPPSSSQLALKLMVLPPSGLVPFIVIIAVDIVYVQTASYRLLALLYPSILKLFEGCPANEPESSSTRKRPASVIESFASPAESIAGAPGPVNLLDVV